MTLDREAGQPDEPGDEPADRQPAAPLGTDGLDEPGEGARLEGAVDAALASSPTPDLGGQATTTEFADAVLRALSSR